eukprot:gene19649-26335_t
MSGELISDDDIPFVKACINNVFIFNHLMDDTQSAIVSTMRELFVTGGSMFITEGDVGTFSTEMFVVKSGTFDVLTSRDGFLFKVATRGHGDCFGETSLMYSSPRSACVYAPVDSTVWVLTRDAMRSVIKEMSVSHVKEIEVFLNSVPLLDTLGQHEKLALAEAFHHTVHPTGDVVVKQGESGDRFYIIKSGVAIVSIDGRTINKLFRSDFFGEKALLNDTVRNATVIF